MSTPAGGFGINHGALDKAHGTLTNLAHDCPGAGGVADDATGTAVGALKGWDSAGALKDSLDEWHKQVQALTGRLNANAAAMQSTGANYRATNQSIAQSFQVQ
ncbi:hypothetical protein ACIG5E_29300 [Kitasatospora sp. NPDC053057]|uniref:hypothetical protein n=1 Tax=Kitasatospora sp. NPDC053057 TaxID=3364062 RepID=UPI0037C76F52